MRSRRRRRSPAPGPTGRCSGRDANGIMLPQGFTSRVIARAGLPVPDTAYVFPPAPDGQATYAVRGRLDPRRPTRRFRRRRRRIGDPLRRATARSSARTGSSANTSTQLRRRADAVGHLAVVRGGRARAASGNATRPATGRRRLPGAGRLPARGRVRRPGQRARLPHRGRVDGGLYRFTPDRLSRTSTPAGWRSRCDGAAGRWCGRRCRTRSSRVRPSCGAGAGHARLRPRRGHLVRRRARLRRDHPRRDDPHLRHRGPDARVLYRASEAPGTPLRNVDNVHVSRSGDLFVAEDPPATPTRWTSA